MTISKRIDAVTEIPVRFRQTFLPAPQSLKIEITSRCNLSCSFCVKSLIEDESDMDRALYSRVIREAKAFGVKELGVFFVGESFTCKWLPEAIKEAKEIGFEYVFLTTNGGAASQQRIYECMAAGLDSLKFSLNFYDEEQFVEIARAPKHLWRKAIDNVKAARRIRDDHGFKCGIYASSIAFNGEQGRKMQSVIDEVKPYLDEHYFLPLFGMNGASSASGMSPGAGNPGRLDAMRDPLPCWAVSREAHVDRRGHMIACCFGDSPDGGLDMADLTKVSFREGWNSEPFQELRAAHLKKDVCGTACEKCIAA
jgi:organic radical activating enzyme